MTACGASGDYAADAPSAGDETGTLEVPDVTGRDGADAVSELESTGLGVSLEDQDGMPRDDGAGCTVEDQTPTAGDAAEEGDVVALAFDCRDVDWEAEEGRVWDEFTSGYEAGFEEGCMGLFQLSPTGSLFDGDNEYTSTDCPTAEVADAEKPGDPDDPGSEGRALGLEDGCEAVFDDVAFALVLYHGIETCTVHSTVPDPRGDRRGCAARP